MEKKMEKPLMLLPFVHGIDTTALAYAVDFAREEDVTLLLVSLFHLPDASNRQGIRLEAIAQAYDFFEVMAYKAARAGVTIKCMQLSTQHIARSIQMLAQEMLCAGILLFVRDARGVLVETEDIWRLLERGGRPVYLFNLTSHKDRVLLARTTLAKGLRHLLK
jgi:hypothetical protein